MSDVMDGFLAKMAARKVELDGLDAKMQGQGVDVAALRGAVSDSFANKYAVASVNEDNGRGRA